MTTENKRPNFYLLLNLNPEEDLKQEELERAIRDKRIEWSRQGSGIAKKSLAAKHYLTLIPTIQQVMADPTLREAEAKNARAEIISGRKAEQERFTRELIFINSKDYVEQSELDSFTKDFSSILSDKEILARITVPLKKNTPTATPATAPQLDPTTAKDIDEKLALLGSADLYALLKRPPTTSSTALYQAAKDLYNEMITRQPKTAEVTLQSDLAGYSRTIFKTEESRKPYDETLRQRSLNALLKDLEKSVNRTTGKEVHEKQGQTFIMEACKAGWSEEVARARLKEYAQAHKWLIQLPGATAGPVRVRCGNCHEMNKSEDHFCWHCKQELLTTCPDCKYKVATDGAVCGRCGFAVGNRYWVDTLLEKARDSRDIAQIQQLLHDAERLWQPKTEDTRVRKMRDIKATLQKRLQEQQHTRDELHQLIEQHQLYTARRFLDVHKDAVPEPEKQRQEIERGISKARDLLRQSQSQRRNYQQCIDLCRQALRRCTDFKEARDFLHTMPPPAPTNLEATVSGQVIHLSWTPVSTSGIKYRVLRKSHARPNSVHDGKVVATVSGQSYDDERPEKGLPLYYAIFSELEDVTSDDGIFLTKPLLLLQDVTNLIVSVDHQKVHFSWQAPAYTYRVTIIRKERLPPKTPQDGTLMATCDQSQKEFIDHNVEDGHVYYYGIYCQFQNHEGRLITSPGISRRVSPEAPPAAITQLEIEEVPTANGQEIRLHWQLPTKGTVVIIKSDHPLPQQAYPASQLSTLGAEIVKDLPTTATDLVVNSILAYYTPIVIFNERAYVGVSHRYAHVDNVTDLTQQNLGTAIRLKWHWPERCQEVYISLDLRHWPLPDDAMVTTHKVRRAEYERLGYYDLKGVTEQNHYIVVSAVIVQGKEEIISHGVRIQARLVPRLVMTYEIKKPTVLNRHYTLLINMRTSGPLPAMILVGKRDMLPFHKDDGTPLHHIRPGPIDSGKKLLVVQLSKRDFPYGTYGKLFLEDDGMYEFVEIYHPSEDKLRLYK